MASWSEIEAAEGPFATRVRTVLDAHKHKTIATLRKDGSPRISGIEAFFVDGDLWFGGMWQSLKCLDLLRDDRFALHSASEDPPDGDPAGWSGDAKVAGRAVAVTDADVVAKVLGTQPEVPTGPVHLFRADLTEVVLTYLVPPAEGLTIDSWHEGVGLRTRLRK